MGVASSPDSVVHFSPLPVELPPRSRVEPSCSAPSIVITGVVVARTPVGSYTHPRVAEGGLGGVRTEKNRRPFPPRGGGSMTTKRTWSAEEKRRLVLEGLHPNANVEAGCRAPGIDSS